VLAKVLSGAENSIKGVFMDREGWKVTKEALEELEFRVGVVPVPVEDDNVRFVTAYSSGGNVEDILNCLDNASLMTRASFSKNLPLFRLIGQSSVTGPRPGDRPTHYLTFEDLRHPGSRY